ncbi:hypothetical protein KGD82_00520 [Nocardiopsis eucommiae]|uniref:Uncharacterized protein n=1 Tax=Nocardiopsis eucommiae TaxID=2831970 RepID=A0A975QJH1_9ACTN|nr:hypothetical protein KGD82_00520 [Nocardiopsis eucommiae]
MNARPPALPRPTAAQVLGARVRIHAAHHPAAFAGGGGLVAGAFVALLALLSAAPGLTDPTGAPGWLLAGVAGAMLVGALVVALLLGLYARSLPKVAETDPVRYATARIQAASGELGPDPETNRLAHRMSTHTGYGSDPRHHLAPMLVILAFVTVRPLAEIIGPDFAPSMLFQLTPAVLLVLLVVPAHRRAMARYSRITAFRDRYESAHS